MKYGIATLLLLVTLVWSGPRVNLDDTVTTPLLPDDLDQYLQQREARFPDIRPNTNKTILWANPAKPVKTPLSLIYLHGFAASRQEISPVTENLASMLSANLFHTRLSGHGRRGAAMADISVKQLANDAVEALQIGKTIGGRTIVVGTSTGATLAAWLAAHDPEHHIAALVLISPNFALHRGEAELMLLPWGNVILKLVEGEQYRFTPANELQAQYWTTAFPSKALLTMMGLVKITREKYLHKIHQPVLVLYSPNDTVVNVNAITQHYAELRSPRKKLVAIEQSGDPQNHVLAGHIMSPQTTDRVVSEISTFVEQLRLARENQ